MDRKARKGKGKVFNILYPLPKFKQGSNSDIYRTRRQSLYYNNIFRQNKTWRGYQASIGKKGEGYGYYKHRMSDLIVINRFVRCPI